MKSTGHRCLHGLRWGVHLLDWNHGRQACSRFGCLDDRWRDVLGDGWQWVKRWEMKKWRAPAELLSWRAVYISVVDGAPV
jgi:hypothetical protein